MKRMQVVGGLFGLNFAILLTSALVFGVVAGVLGLVLVASGVSGVNGIGLWLGVSLLFLFVQWYFGPALIRWSTGARPLAPGEEIGLQEIVDRLAGVAGIPTPKILIVKSPVPNAFAFGRTQKSSFIAVHTALLEKLGDKEVEAVIAHELGHIKHRDVMVMTVASALPVILYYAFIMFGSAFFGGRDRRGAGDFLLVWLGAMFAQFLGTLLVFFLSRTRESYADAFSAYATRSPQSLMSALAKISYLPQKPKEAPNSGVRALYIAEPSGGRADLAQEVVAAVAHGNEAALKAAIEKEKGRGVMELLMTHPPTWKRLERLLKIQKELGA